MSRAEHPPRSRDLSRRYDRNFRADDAYRATLPDMQNKDASLIQGANVPIQHVGISGFRLPMLVVTRDGKEYLIPNEDLITGQVVNWSHSNDLVRLDLHFGVSYRDSPHDVRKLAIKACLTSSRVLPDPAPVCHIVNFGDSSVDYVLRFWIRDPSAGLTNIRGNVYLALWDAFHENGVSIPFPQREVRILGERPEAPADDTKDGAGARA